MSNPSDAEILAAQEAAMIYVLRHNIDLVAEGLKHDKFLPGEIAATIRQEMKTGRQAEAALASIVRVAVRDYIANTVAYDSALSRELRAHNEEVIQ